MITNQSDDEEPMTYAEVLQQSRENVKLYTDPSMADYIKKKHFDKNASIYYMEPDDLEHIIEERPDGSIIRRPIDRSARNQT